RSIDHPRSREMEPSELKGGCRPCGSVPSPRCSHPDQSFLQAQTRQAASTSAFRVAAEEFLDPSERNRKALIPSPCSRLRASRRASSRRIAPTTVRDSRALPNYRERMQIEIVL